MTEVLYRKYRPKSFDEIVGQDHVVTVLSNALDAHEVAHAYLFSGPRGTGKTSVARILADKLEITGVDLVEIDAASHRGIDQIREIKEAVNFRPTESLRKLYILDEVHMLTKEAFNALLKTLEEPPEFVHFVLCTTEPHKVPITVSSRCQQFTFSLASVKQLKDYVLLISQKEGKKISQEVAYQIAQHAAGSYRDALVLLEQTMSYSVTKNGSPIDFLGGSVKGVNTVVGKLYNAVIQKDRLEFFRTIEDARKMGVSFRVLTDRLLEHVGFEVSALGGDNDGDKNKLVGNIEVLERLLMARRRMSYVDDPTTPFLLEISKLLFQEFENYQSSAKQDTKSKKGTIVRSTQAKVDGVLKKETKKQESQIEDSFKTDNFQTEARSKREFNWEEILSSVRERKRSVEALLRGGEPKGITERDELEIEFKYAFHKEKFEQIENRAVLELVLEESLGRKIKVVSRLKQSNYHSGEWIDRQQVDVSLPVSNEKETTSSSTRSHSTGGTDDLLSLAQEVFGGQMIE